MLSFKWRRIKAHYSSGSPFRTSGWYAETGIKEECFLGSSGNLTKYIKEGKVRIYVEKGFWKSLIAKWRGHEQVDPRQQLKKKEDARKKQKEYQKQRVIFEQKRKAVEEQRRQLEAAKRAAKKAS